MRPEHLGYRDAYGVGVVRLGICLALIALAEWQRIPLPDPGFVILTIIALLSALAQDIKEIIRK